jgi:hypothetical protein
VTTSLYGAVDLSVVLCFECGAEKQRALDFFPSIDASLDKSFIHGTNLTSPYKLKRVVKRALKVYIVYAGVRD